MGGVVPEQCELLQIVAAIAETSWPLGFWCRRDVGVFGTTPPRFVDAECELEYAVGAA
jgi:hypothetical protein